MRGGPSPLRIVDMVGSGVEIQSYERSPEKDNVHVAEIEDGGLISYEKDNGLFIHTLNDSEGFRRKLRDLTDSPI